jgi:GAF domain-containing protein
MMASQPIEVRSATDLEEIASFRARIDQYSSLEDVLNAAGELAIRSVSADAGEIWLVDFNRGRLHRSWANKMLPEWGSDWARGVAEESCHNRPFGPARSVMRRPDMEYSIIALPIESSGLPLGALVLSSTAHGFSPSVERFLHNLARETAAAITRVRRLTAFSEISSATARAMQLDRVLDLVLSKIEALNFGFATVSVVDEYRNLIETIRAVNVPPTWVKLAHHDLDSTDIQAHVVKTRQALEIVGEDPRLDPEISRRFGHANVARIFVPVLVGGKAVGTIEAGCHKDMRHEILSLENKRKVEALAEEYGATIAEARPFVVVELIARHPLDVLAAYSASLHVYESRKPLLLAGTGRATIDFLRKFEPRPDGLGRKAMDTQEIQVADDAAELAISHPNIYEQGVRAMIAIPFSPGDGIEGVLYVHFWEEHKLSPSELRGAG